MRFSWFIVRVDVDEQCLAHLGQPQSDIGESLHWFLGHFDIDIGGVVIEFVEEIPEIVLIGKFSEYLDLDALDVGGLLWLAVEIFEVLLEVLLAVHVDDHVFDVLEHHEHRLIAARVLVAGHEGDEGSFDLLDDGLVELLLPFGKL